MYVVVNGPYLARNAIFIIRISHLKHYILPLDFNY
jgi:hypothetical protein